MPSISPEYVNYPPVTASHQGSYSLSQIKKGFKNKIERIFPSTYSKMKSRDQFPHQPKQKELLTLCPIHRSKSVSRHNQYCDKKSLLHRFLLMIYLRGISIVLISGGLFQKSVFAQCCFNVL